MKNEDYSIGYFCNRSLTYSVSQRGRPILWYLGHRFRKERQANHDRAYWRCLKAKCAGRCILYKNEVVKYHKHNHEPLLPNARKSRYQYVDILKTE